VPHYSRFPAAAGIELTSLSGLSVLADYVRSTEAILMVSAILVSFFSGNATYMASIIVNEILAILVLSNFLNELASAFWAVVDISSTRCYAPRHLPSGREERYDLRK